MTYTIRVNPLGPNNSNKKYYSKDVPTGKHKCSIDWNPDGLDCNISNSNTSSSSNTFKSHPNNIVNELFQNLEVTDEEYNLANSFFNDIINQPLSSEQTSFITKGQNKKELAKWVFSNSKQNLKYKPISFNNEGDTVVIINDIPRTGISSFNIDIITNFLYLIRMFYSFELDYKNEKIFAYPYTQGQLLFSEVLLIENDPVVGYIILHKTIFSTKLTKLSVNSWLPSDDITYLKIQYIIYRFIKLYKPNYKHINKIPQIIFNLGQNTLIYPIPALHLLLHEFIYYGKIKNTYKIFNLFYKYKAGAFFLIVSVLISDFLNNNENDNSLKDNPICNPECLDDDSPVCNQTIFAAMWAKNIGCSSKDKSKLIQYKPSKLSFYNFEKLIYKIEKNYRNINNFIMEIMQDFDNFYRQNDGFKNIINKYGALFQSAIVNKNPNEIVSMPGVEKYMTFFKDIPTKDFKWVLIGGKSKRKRKTKKIKYKIKNNTTKKSIYKDGWVILDYNPNKNKTRKNRK